MSEKMKEIKEYWDQQAILTRIGDEGDSIKIYDKDKNVFYHPNGGGTSKDLALKELETGALLRQFGIFHPKSVLEVGCGMGLMTMELAKQQQDATFVGVDYSAEMISNAKTETQHLDASVAARISFDCADVLELSSDYPVGQFEVILTDRCLINLSEWDLQKRAIQEIAALLPKGGVFLMMEGSQQGLANLNFVRQKFGMGSITPVWHNLFFDETLLMPFVEPLFDVKEIDSFCSTFMLVSRVLHHKLRDQDPSFNAPINEMATFLPNMGDYGYLKLYVFVKK